MRWVDASRTASRWLLSVAQVPPASPPRSAQQPQGCTWQLRSPCRLLGSFHLQQRRGNGRWVRCYRRGKLLQQRCGRPERSARAHAL